MKRKRVKMPVKIEEHHHEELEISEPAGDTLESMELDFDQDEQPSSGANDIIDTLENTSGLKLVKYVVVNSKDICKLLSAHEHLLFSRRVAGRVSKVCEKHRHSSEKCRKFFSKVFGDIKTELSCENDLFRTILKYGMKYPGNSQCGPAITEILEAVFSVGASNGKVQNPTLGIQMIISHSKAADIFLESHKFVKKSQPNQKSRPAPTTIVKLEEGIQEDEENFSQIKAQLLKLWKNLAFAFTQISKSEGTENDKKILENSVPYLLQMYTATMSEADQEIFNILQLCTGKRLQISIEGMPLFGPKCFEPVTSKSSNPLFAHSARANTVLNLINDQQAFRTAMEFTEYNVNTSSNPKHYDVRFLLPLLCHTLDEKNICDAVKVVSNGWIYLIVRGMSCNDPVLRNLSFLAFKLLIQNFQLPKKGYKMHDIKVWLHFLLSVRKGLQNLGKCKISNLLAVWMVATWEVVRQPAHPMYPRLTTFLFAKPVIDMTIVPDFVPFYNASNGNRVTREWILNVLSHGLQDKDDWQVAQRNPTINSLCCSFLVETVFVQRDILRILRGGAKIPEVAQEMVDRHSLLLWIANISCEKHAFKRELHNLFQSLKDNCPHGENRQLLFQYVANMQGWNESEHDDAASGLELII